MEKEDIIVPVIGTVIALIIIGGVFWGFSTLAYNGMVEGRGGLATDNTYKICSGEGKEVYEIWGTPVNSCEIKDCSLEYDGITYCDKRVFVICGNDFCKQAWDD